MKTSRTVEGPTPNGGVRMTAFFFDANDQPCEEKESVSVQIIEYDENDVPVFTIISRK